MSYIYNQMSQYTLILNISEEYKADNITVTKEWLWTQQVGAMYNIMLYIKESRF